MTERIHIYCDESCHLENDHMRAMVLGAVWCPASHRQSLADKIKRLKADYGLPAQFEIKWVMLGKRNTAEGVRFYLLKTAYCLRSHNVRRFAKERDAYWASQKD